MSHPAKLQNKREESLNEVILRLQAIINTAIDGIVTIDHLGKIEMINPSGASLFGYKPEEIISKNINILMPSPYNSEHDKYIKRYIDGGKPRIIGLGREVFAQKKDGTIFPIRLSVNETMINGKRIFTGIIHDLTEIKSAENQIKKLNQELEDKVHERTETLAKVVNQLLRTNKKLEKEVSDRKAAEQELLKTQKDLRTALEKEKELNELKSRFVSMASHEFRTPLSTILSSVSIILRYDETEHQSKREKHIKRIKTAVKNLNSILDDFLSLSKLEEGKLVCRPESFNIQEFWEEMRDQIEGLLKNGQVIEYRIEVAAPEIFLDKQMLRNILFNLLSNAIKYSDENASIHFKILRDREKITITVKDHGMGIPKEDQAYLFTRFFRAHNAINIQGTGLGLNIVRKYVELMKGKISFESQVGTGSTFVVSIPCLL